MEEEGDMMFGIRTFGEYVENHPELFIDDGECICNEGIHDGKRIDCACGCHK